MKRNTVLTLVIGLIISVGAISLWRVGAAAPAISQGYDVFDTPDNAATYENLSLPAGLFGTGSDAFRGQAVFKGGAAVPGFNGDTVIWRSQDVNTLPGDTPLTLFGLRLVSAAPIQITFGGGNAVKYDITVKESSISPSTGTMHFEADGTYSNTLLVNREYTFTSPGRTTVVYDSAANGMAPISLASSGTWSYGSNAAPVGTNAAVPVGGTVIIKPNPHAAAFAQHVITVTGGGPHPTPTQTATPVPTRTKTPIGTTQPVSPTTPDN